MTEEIRQKFLEAKTEEEAKAVFDSMNGELDDEDLELISGGKSPWKKLWNGVKETASAVAQIGEGVGEVVAGAVVSIAAVPTLYDDKAFDKVTDTAAKLATDGLDKLGIKV